MTTDNIPSPDANPAPPPEPPAAKAPRRIGVWPFVAVAVLALAGWQWQDTRQQLDETRREVARRLADADATGKEERGARDQLLEQIEGLQARFGAVENRLAEFESQGETLQSMYEDLANGRAEAALLEVEQALTLAEQQLQLAGNVAVAALALQTADARLARLDQPRYVPLRNALAQDLARLNALPFVDVGGISLRLEDIVAAVDKLPLVALDRPAVPVSPAVAGNGAGAPWWRLIASDIWRELRGLVRIQRVDHEEPVLLAPEQAFFLRENLKLRLLNARLALLARDHSTFRSELKVAQGWLQRHFAVDDPAVKETQDKLQQLLAADFGADLPGLSDSLAALAKLRGGKEAR